jgi:hypothetical protein
MGGLNNRCGVQLHEDRPMWARASLSESRTSTPYPAFGLDALSFGHSEFNFATVNCNANSVAFHSWPKHREEHLQ